MEGLRWWLLLLTAVMFSMSGCATAGESWSAWTTHHAHFASAHHFKFSMKPHETEASITEQDMVAAAREEWWGRLVPEGPEGPGAPGAPEVPQAALPSMDMTGKWRGTWVSRGLFGDERASDVQATFRQAGKSGVGLLALNDVNAATGLPARFRAAGFGRTAVL